MGAADGLRRRGLRSHLVAMSARLRMTLRGSPDARELEFLADVQEHQGSGELLDLPNSCI